VSRRQSRRAGGTRPRADGGPASAVPGRTEVAGGTAELLADADRPGSWELLLDGVPQSHVDLADPTHLEFEYVRRIGHVLDQAAERGAPLDVVHLGGGAMTLPRYVAVTRPGSRQRVVEVDQALTDLVRTALPLPRSARVRVRADDARAGLATLPDASADVVVVDVFAGARTPAHLTTVEFATDVARALRPGGVTVWNVSDGPPLRFVRVEAATLGTVFAHVALLAEPGTLRGRRFGNTVAVASDAELPVAALTRRCAGDPMPSRVVAGEDLVDFVGQAQPVRDGAAEPSPQPPAGVFDL
jgi:spermine/spermidine synthase